MAILLADPETEAQLLAKRRAWGADKYDEVWEGLYVMHAYPGDEHQELVNRFSRVLTEIVEDPGLGKVRPGVNVAADPDDWRQDYRCPDVVAFLNDTHAECHGAFWTSVDFAIEIVSPGDQSREKLGFYARVGAREVLLVDRDPWAIELFRNEGRELVSVGRVDLSGQTLASEVLPIELRLRDAARRPEVSVTHRVSQQTWVV